MLLKNGTLSPKLFCRDPTDGSESLRNRLPPPFYMKYAVAAAHTHTHTHTHIHTQVLFPHSLSSLFLSHNLSLRCTWKSFSFSGLQSSESLETLESFLQRPAHTYTR